MFDYYDEVLKDIGNVTNIDFSKRIRTLGEIKQVIADSKKKWHRYIGNSKSQKIFLKALILENTLWKSDKMTNPSSLVITGLDGYFILNFLQKSGFCIKYIYFHHAHYITIVHKKQDFSWKSHKLYTKASYDLRISLWY